MATFYVRKTGSDSNNGTTPALAWATVGKALGASGISSGDMAYVGAGAYRETVTVAMTSAVAETQIIGDVDGAQTGDKGEVRLTAYTTNDTTAPGATVLSLAGRDFLTFKKITFVSGSTNSSLILSATQTSVNIKFSQCTFLPGSVAAGCRLCDPSAAADIAWNWTFDSCYMLLAGLQARFQPPTSTVADYDINVVFQNCVIVSLSGGAFSFAPSGANSFKPGGLKFYNCTIFSGNTMLITGANTSTSIPVTVYNCVILCQGVTALSANASGQIVEDYNSILAGTPRTNVSIGTHSKSDGSYSSLIDIGQSLVYAGLSRPFGMPTPDSPLLAFASQAGGPSTDALGVTRPSAPFSAGAYEFETPPNRVGARVFTGF